MNGNIDLLNNCLLVGRLVQPVMVNWNLSRTIQTPGFIHCALDIGTISDRYLNGNNGVNLSQLTEGPAKQFNLPSTSQLESSYKF